MTDEEAMEALFNSDGYSFPTWTLKLGLPTDEMRLVILEKKLPKFFDDTKVESCYSLIVA